MAKQTINIGTAPNAGNGDPLRTGFTKTNANFTELYTAVESIPTDVNQLLDTDGLLNATDLGLFKIEGNTLGIGNEGNGWGATGINLSPNGEGYTWIGIPNDTSAAGGASLQIGNTSATGGGIQLLTNGGYWTFQNDGSLTAPGDITTGTIGGRFIQDCDDGTTAMRWINVNQGNSTTQLIRAYTGDPKLDTEVERVQVKLNWDDTENLSGLTIRTFNQTNPNSEVNYDWNFKGNGTLQLPVGGDIVDSDGNSVLGTVVNPLYLMVNVDGNISRSTNGTEWSTPTDIGINIGTVAVGPNKIIYTRADVNQDANNPGLYSTSRPSVPPTLIEGTNGNPGGDLYWMNVEYFEGAPYPWVAVGYQSQEFRRPVVIYSSNGVGWEFADINLESAYDTSNLEFTDVAYGNGYYVITARGSTNAGGMWFTQDLTQTISLSSNQVAGLEADFKFIEYFTEQDGFHKWNAVATNNQWWASSLADPSVFVTGESSEGWFNLFDESGLSAIIEDETGLANQSIEEFASGQIDGYSYWMASTGDGHIIWWPNAPAGPFVSIPQPYTGTVTGITDSTTAAITYDGQGYEEIGEKFVISGSSVEAYNGTYYIGVDGAMFTDAAMTTPFDSSALQDDFTGTATITWSHGTYIDSLGFANNAFFAGNDDDEIFKGQMGEGLYWTKVDDRNNSLEYWNDFAYYPEFNYSSSNTSDITFDGVNIIGQAASERYGLINLIPALAANDTFSSINFVESGQYVSIYPTLAFDAPHIHIAAGIGLEGAEGDLFLGDDNKYVEVNHGGNVNVQSYDPDLNNTYRWTFDNTGVLKVPGDGLIQSVDGDGKLRSQLRLDAGSDITRLSGLSSQNNQYFDTNNWATGEYISGEGGTIQFTGASAILNWLNTNGYAGRFFYTVNDGPQMASNGWGGGGDTVTFYVTEVPEISPTTITSFRIYYQYESMLDIDPDDGEFILRAVDLDLILETRNSRNIEVNSDDGLTLDGNGSVVLRNRATDNGILIQTDTTDSNYTWNFGEDGSTTLPGAVVESVVAKTGTLLPTTTGGVTGISHDSSLSGLTDGNYGPFTLGSTTIYVSVFNGVIISSVGSINTPGTGTVGDPLGTIDSGDVGGTAGTTITITVTSVQQETPTPLDLTKSINKLTSGWYTLADGVEGQIMHLVRQTSEVDAGIRVYVTNQSRVGASEYTNNYFENIQGVATLIYTDGAWQASNVTWD